MPKTKSDDDDDGKGDDRDLRVPCYCEENAWRVARRHLLRLRADADAERNRNRNDDDAAPRDCCEYHVAFVSNARRCCPFYRQRALPEDEPGEYVCWDYHVFVIRTSRETNAGGRTTTTTDAKTQIVEEAEALDVDTWLTCPCPLGEYLDGSFPHAKKPGLVDPSYLPVFRVVRAEAYLKYFYSDRSHMFKEGRWLATPPEYEPIMDGLPFAEAAGGEGEGGGKKGVSNLEMYIDMSSGNTNKNDERRGKVYSLDQFRDAFHVRDEDWT